MNAKSKFMSTLLVIDTFFVSYAVGFNSRHVLVVDPKLPPYVKLTPAPAESGDNKIKPKKPAPEAKQLSQSQTQSHKGAKNKSATQKTSSKPTHKATLPKPAAGGTN